MSTPSITARPLGALASHVANEPGIDAIAGQRDAVLAVPEVARATVLMSRGSTAAAGEAAAGDAASGEAAAETSN